MDNRYIIIFDGVCNFCNGAVHFIIKRDPKRVFAFTPMQSATAKDIMLKYRVPTVGIDTVILLKDGVCSVRSDAVLEIIKILSGPWYLLRVFRILPVPIRDGFYKLIAHNRYKLFGQQNSCMVPTAEIRDRFIE